MRKLALCSFLVLVASCADREVAEVDAIATPLAFASTHHDTSPPLTQLVAAPAIAHADLRDDDEASAAARVRPISPDTVAQTTIAATAPAVDVQMEGLGAGQPGFPYATPPDTNAAVGATQVMEVVNDSLAVWNKTGTLVYGPKPTNTLFGGFGGPCETTNDGDAKVRYDALAGRWVVVYFSYWNQPYGLCIAVSSTSDATGSWHRYFWQFNSQTDSPMLGIWPDAYYVGINGILTADNLQIPVCAFDRNAMLSGAQATRQCFSVASIGSPPFPADFTGGAAPPAGAPELVLNIDFSVNNAINAFKVHVDWATPSNSTITNVGPIAVAPYTQTTTLAPQPGTDGLEENTGANPVSYRNFGDHESWVWSTVVWTNNVNAPRWYELRATGGNPTVYQQGTFAPADGLHRFMSSAALDKNGDIALGYSVSSGAVYPSIRFTGRLVGDTLGTMTQGEGSIIAGAGSQPGGGRWGDYSSMSVDPTDGCTFWYAQEYMGSDPGNGWRTRLASFHLPGCAVTPPPPPGGIVNGDFETGALTPWTSAGSASITTTVHGGAKAAMVGSTGPTTDSSIAQTFTAPSTGGTLSFWYRVTCPDTVTYDWATATLKDNTASTTSTMLPKTCTNSGAWVQVSATLVGGHSYTLTLANHDDNYAGDATYTIYDDVAISTSTPPPPPPSLANGGFESGAFTPWTTSGTTSIATTPHTGTYAALGGKVGVTTKGDSSIVQTFAAPATGGTLSFYYKVVCLDSLTYDWATATLKDVTAGTTTTPLAKKCSNTGAWSLVSAALVANHTYTLTLTSHDDGYSNADATYTLFDDAAIK